MPKGSRLARGGMKVVECQTLSAISKTTSRRSETLAGHKAYREGQKVANEWPRGTLSTGEKPDRRQYADDHVAWEEAFRAWEAKNVAGKVRQNRSEATYEHTAGRINDWLERTGHPPFAHWVKGQRDSLHELELNEVKGDDGSWTVTMPTVEQIIDWIFAYATGDAPKGGSKEYRAGPWYAPIMGKTQAEHWMSGPAKAFGYGPFAELPPVQGTIEQNVSKLRQWLQDKLRMHPTVANPCLNVRVKEALARLEGEQGRHRMEERLPRVLTEEEVGLAICHAKITVKAAGSLEKAIEETQTILYTAKNALLHGERAHDGYWYNWGEWTSCAEGVELSAVATKNNKKQVDRPKKALPCVSGCGKQLRFTEEGYLVRESFCTAEAYVPSAGRISA